MNVNNPFDLFGLKPQLNINSAALDKAFQRLQLLCHPDKHICPVEKQAARSLSAKISTLYSELKTPLGCLNAILKLHNLDCIENLSKTLNNMDTMQEVFSMQEKLMDLKFNNDCEGIKQLDAAVKERITDIESLFILAHEHNHIQDLKQQAIRFSYFVKFYKSIG